MIEVQGHQITATRRGATKRRDAKKFKNIKVTPARHKGPQILHDEESSLPFEQAATDARSMQASSQIAQECGDNQEAEGEQMNQMPPQAYVRTRPYGLRNREA